MGISLVWCVFSIGSVSGPAIEDVTPHVLRHTFASIAAELAFSELTIAGLLDMHREG